ncbi:MAG: adenylosuccinate lyase, partial [Loigolactobacillus coryniformis]|nr:adenylosuccinate lyase [Loigolactobacillus coryniformis]
MLERYTRPEMGQIWTDQNRYQAWVEVETLADEAGAEIGEVPKEAAVK